eukprot:scaffold57627_cov54-Attheya_sp.AAC.2
MAKWKGKATTTKAQRAADIAQENKEAAGTAVPVTPVRMGQQEMMMTVAPVAAVMKKVWRQT